MEPAEARILSLVIAALLVSVPGCLDVQEPSYEEVSFRTIIDEAMREARAWREEAVLLGAGASESHFASRYGTRDHQVAGSVENHLLADTDRDGKARLWHFVFADPRTGDRLAVAWDGSDGRPVLDREYPHHEGLAQVRPVGDRLLDSHEAVRVAKEDRAFRDAIGSSSHVLTVLTVPDDTGVPYWTIVARSPMDTLMRVVDARSGERQDPAEDGMSVDWDELMFYAGYGHPTVMLHSEEWTVRLTATEPTAEHRFPLVAQEVYDVPVWTQVWLCYPGDGPAVLRAGTISYRLEDPDGTVLLEGRTTDILNYTIHDHHGLPTGEATASFRLEEGSITMGYRFGVHIGTKSERFTPSMALSTSMVVDPCADPDG